jgi:hypothetical protein
MSFLYKLTFKAMDKKFSLQEIQAVAKKLNIDWNKIDWDMAALEQGMNIELEHADITNGDPMMTAKIAIVHLNERPDYYMLLEKLEQE